MRRGKGVAQQSLCINQWLLVNTTLNGSLKDKMQ